MTTSVQALDFQKGLSDAWTSVATFVPKLVAFLAILVIGWIVAKVLTKLVAKVLEKVGFNKLLDKSGLNDILAKSNFDAAGILVKLVHYAILLLTLQFAFGVFGTTPISELLTSIVAWLPRAFVAIIIIVVVAAIAKAVKDIISNALADLSYGGTLATIASLFIWGAGIIAALNQVGVGTTVTQPLLNAVLASLAGVTIVGVGGGLIKPMQSRWENWLEKVEAELPKVKTAANKDKSATPGSHAVSPGNHAL